MATLNLGRIKPVFRGAWTTGAYVIDDIVTHGNESFICIQAGSNIATTNASYWTKLAAKGTDGTNGTDLGTVITTQGDIAYRDGSGLQRLAKGTAGQVLKMNTAANAPEWGTDAGGSILAVSNKMYGGTNEINTSNRTSNFTFTSNSYEISNLTHTLTPSSNTSKFLFQINLQATHSDSYVGMGWLTYQVAGGTEYAVASSGTRGITFRFDDGSVGSSNAGNASIACCVMIAPTTTSDVTFRVRIASASSNYPWYINRSPGNNTDVDDGGYMISTSTVYELDGSKSTKGTNSVNETKT